MTGFFLKISALMSFVPAVGELDFSHKQRGVWASLLALSALCFLTGCTSQLTDLDSLTRLAGELPPWKMALTIALATLVTEDLATIVAGILAGNGLLSYFWALTGSLAGVLVGDFGLYVIGYFGGLPLLKRAPFRWWISEEKVEQGAQLFREHGGKIIFSSRLVPGTRFPIYLAAGIVKYPFWKYFLLLNTACIASTLILLYLSMRLGKVLLDYLKVYETYAIPILIAVVAIVWVTVKLIEIMATRQSRLRFLARLRKIWRRITGRKKGDSR